MMNTLQQTTMSPNPFLPALQAEGAKVQNCQSNENTIQQSFWQMLFGIFEPKHNTEAQSAAVENAVVTDEQIDAARILLNRGEFLDKQEIANNNTKQINTDEVSDLKMCSAAFLPSLINFQNHSLPLNGEKLTEEIAPAIKENYLFQSKSTKNFSLSSPIDGEVKNNNGLSVKLETPFQVEKQKQLPIAELKENKIFSLEKTVKNESTVADTVRAEPQSSFTVPQTTGKIQNNFSQAHTEEIFFNMQNASAYSNFPKMQLSKELAAELNNDGAHFFAEERTVQPVARIFSKQELLARLTLSNDNRIKRNNSNALEKEAEAVSEATAFSEISESEIPLLKNIVVRQNETIKIKPENIGLSKLNTIEETGKNVEIIENNSAQKIKRQLNVSTHTNSVELPAMQTVSADTKKEKDLQIQNAINENDIPRELNQTKADNSVKQMPHSISEKITLPKNAPQNLEPNNVTTESARFATSVERVNSLLENITKIISQRAKEPMQEVRIMLKPGSLGELIVKVAVEENKVQAQIDVTNNSVKAVLESNLSALKESFSQRGLEVQRLTIQTGNELSYSQSQQQSSFRQSKNQSRFIEEFAEEEQEFEKYFGYNTIELKA